VSIHDLPPEVRGDVGWVKGWTAKRGRIEDTTEKSIAELTICAANGRLIYVHDDHDEQFYGGLHNHDKANRDKNQPHI